MSFGGLLTKAYQEIDRLEEELRLCQMNLVASERLRELIPDETDKLDAEIDMLRTQLVESAKSLQTAANTIADLARDERLFIPGAWRCPKCNFVLQRATLFMQSGTVGTSEADREEVEPCPNDGVAMRRVTWEERCKELGDRAEEYFTETVVLEEKVEQFRQAQTVAIKAQGEQFKLREAMEQELQTAKEEIVRLSPCTEQSDCNCYKCLLDTISQQYRQQQRWIAEEMDKALQSARKVKI